MALANKPAGTRETAAERRVTALRLRQAGVPYRSIATQCRVSVKTAYHDVDTALRELAELQHHEAAQLRALELARLDGYLLALAPLLAAADLGAIDRGLRLSESRRKLLGLDAPTLINWRRDAEAAGLDADALFRDTVARIEHALGTGAADGGPGPSAAGATPGDGPTHP